MDSSDGTFVGASTLVELQRFDEALVIYRELGASANLEARQRALCCTSDVLVQLGRYTEARDAAQELLTLCPAEGSPLWHGRALGRLGTATWFASGPAAALPLSRRALAALKCANDVPPDELVRAVDNLGLALHSTGAYQEAIDVQSQGLQMAERASRLGDARRIKRRLANTLQDAGALLLAERMMAEIAPAADAIAQDRIGWHNSSAMLAERLGRLGAATGHYHSALAAFDELKPQQQIGFAALLSNAALLFLDLGDEDCADKIISRVQSLVDNGSPLSVRLGLERLQGRMEEAVGDLVAAERHWANAARLVELYGESDVSKAAEFAAIRARLLIQMREPARVLEVLRLFDILQADVADHVHLVEATIEQARAIGLTAPHAELGAPLAAAFIAELERGDAEIGWRLLSQLADWAHGQGNQDAAILLGKLAVRLIFTASKSLRGSHREQALHWKARAQPQAKLLDRLVAAGRLPEAEQMMALGQIDHIATLARRQLRTDQLSNDLPFHEDERKFYRNYISAAQALQKLNADRVDPLLSTYERAQAEAGYGAARLDGRKLFNALASFQISAQRPESVTPTFEKALPAQKAVLRILSTTRAVICVLHDRGGSQSYEISPDQEQFAHEVHALRSAVIGQNAHWQQQAKRVHDLILGPIATRLSDLSYLEVSASGSAQYIPFACLHDGSRCLVERLALSVRSGARATDRAPTPVAHWRVAAFGTAAAQGAQPALFHLPQEISAVAAAFPTARQYIDAAFTRDALANAMSSGVELLHIAAHYHLAAGAAHRSFLSLGDGSSISLSEIAATDFDASRIELAVLSGCDTATIDDGIGGAQSMAGVLQAKGARDVVAALWPIADAGAARLVQAFYNHLRNGAPAEALRAAQIELLNGAGATPSQASSAVCGLGLVTEEVDFAHPYFWAGFAHMASGA